MPEAVVEEKKVWDEADQPGGVFWRKVGPRRNPKLVPFNAKGQQLDPETFKPLPDQDLPENELDELVNGGGAGAAAKPQDVSDEEQNERLPGDEEPADEE